MNMCFQLRPETLGVEQALGFVIILPCHVLSLARFAHPPHDWLNLGHEVFDRFLPLLNLLGKSVNRFLPVLNLLGKSAKKDERVSNSRSTSSVMGAESLGPQHGREDVSSVVLSET